MNMDRTGLGIEASDLLDLIMSHEGFVYGPRLQDEWLKRGKSPQQLDEAISELQNKKFIERETARFTSDELGFYRDTPTHRCYTHDPDIDRGVSLPYLADMGHESFELQVLRNLVRKGDKVIDAGACIGTVTMELSSAVGPEGRVFSFEPCPDNFARIQKSLVYNGRTNVSTFNMALYQNKVFLQLGKHRNNKGDHRIWGPLNQDRKEAITVFADKLDNLFPTETFNFLKIDTQGSEVAILKGAKNLVERSKNLILSLEFWPYGLKGAESSDKELVYMLNIWGYKLYHPDDKKKTLIDVTGDILQRINSTSMDFINIICMRG